MGVYNSNLREPRFSRILENYFAISPLDLEAFKFHFYFSKKVKPKIFSLFISRKEWKHFKFHSFFSRKKSEIMHGMCNNWVMYNTQIQNLWWIYFTKSKNFLDSREFLENSREISLLDLDLEAFSFHFSLLEKSESDFHFTFHFPKRVILIFISLFTSWKEWIRF